MTIRRVVVDNSAPVWAKQLETDLNGTLAGLGSDIQGTVAASRLPVGSVVNSVYAEYTANADISAVIPIDDTPPQNTEGTQILSAAITPTSVTSKIRVNFQGNATGNALMNVSAALFVGANASAVRATVQTVQASDYNVRVALMHEHVPGVTSAVTYTVRVGPGSGIMRLNGNSAGRLFGGTQAATLVLEEIKA